MTLNSLDILDKYYADELGCSPHDLNNGQLIVVTSDHRDIRFAKGTPLPLFSLAQAGGAVISVRPGLEEVVNAALCDANAAVLDDNACDAIERKVSPLVNVRMWFRGNRLFCEPSFFTDQQAGTVECITHTDEHARYLHSKWGGNVFGQIVNNTVVSWAAVKPLSNVAWDLSVETHPDYRGHGYAKSAVSAAVKFIFENSKLATWGTDRTNIASLNTARALGFQDYALDFGCVEI